MHDQEEIEALRALAAALQDNTPWWASSETWIGVGGLIVAVGTVLVSYLIARHEARAAHLTEGLRIALELRIRRLDEFYGRIEMLNTRSNTLYQRLKRGKSDDWRFLPNAAQVIANDDDRELMQEIVDTNQDIDRILRENGGLADTSDEIFGRYQKHTLLVKLAFDGKPISDTEAQDSYPPDWRDYITRKCKEIRDEINHLDARLFKDNK